MKTVYYCISETYNMPGGEFNLPVLGQNVANILKNKFANTANNMHGWLECPATIDSLKNTFEIKNVLPFDFQFKEDNTLEIFSNTKLSKKFTDEWVKNVWFLRSIKDKFASLNYNIYFFCEEDLEIEQHHPWYSDSEFSNNTYQTVGGFNISKWFRPIQATFIAKNNKKINVKKGDSLCYIKFLTNEKIKFVKFEMTEKMHKISVQSTTLKFLSPFQPLKKLYEKFSSLNYNKRIIKEIKNNLIK